MIIRRDVGTYGCVLAADLGNVMKSLVILPM